MSQSAVDGSAQLKWAIAHALSKGVLIVASSGNASSNENATHLGRWSGVIGVSAINSDGTFASYSSWGEGVVTTAFGGPFNSFDPTTKEPKRVNGTSVAAPIVAGMLALTRQKWPDATGNQILQLLVNTSLNPNHAWDQYTGYGAASLADLIHTDPSQYPDENPIISKPGGSEPSAQDVQDYADGVAYSNSDSVFPASYVYRGTEEITAYAPYGEFSVHLGTSPRYHRK